MGGGLGGVVRGGLEGRKRMGRMGEGLSNGGGEGDGFFT